MPAYVSEPRGRRRVPHISHTLSHHQDHEDNNKNITAESLLCQLHILPISSLLLTISSQVEADPADTISVLKDKIAADQGHPVASQKIIFSGISTRSLRRVQFSPE
jgi:hypothetical protein